MYLNTRTPGWKSEDGATSQQAQGFPWLFSVLEQFLSLWPQSKLQFLFLKQPSSTLTQNFREKAVFTAQSKFLHNVLQIQNLVQTPTFIPLLHTFNSPLPSMLPSSFPHASPCFRPTFSRRRSGHHMGTFRTINIFVPHNNNNNNNNNNNKFSASHASSGNHPASDLIGTVGPFAGAKRPWRVADLSPPHSTKVYCHLNTCYHTASMDTYLHCMLLLENNTKNVLRNILIEWDKYIQRYHKNTSLSTQSLFLLHLGWPLLSTGNWYELLLRVK